MNLVPVRVFDCEEVRYDHTLEKYGEKYAEDVKMELFEIRADGKRKLVRSRKYKGTEGKSIDNIVTSRYLRVEFKKKEWYHVYSLERWG